METGREMHRCRDTETGVDRDKETKLTNWTGKQMQN